MFIKVEKHAKLPNIWIQSYVVKPYRKAKNENEKFRTVFTSGMARRCD